MNTPPHPEKIPPSLSEKGFVAGTLVHTSRGLVPIQDIRVGDMVLSRPADGSGEIAYKPVVRTMKSAEKKTIYAVRLFNDTKWDEILSNREDNSLESLMKLPSHEKESMLFCTGEHPFMLEVYTETEGVKWEWTAIRKAYDSNRLVNIAGDEIHVHGTPALVRILPNFPPGFVYTQEEEDARNDEDREGYGIYFVYFDQNGYKMVCNPQEDMKKYSRTLSLKLYRWRLNSKEPMLNDREVMNTLAVRLAQDFRGDIKPYYKPEDRYSDMPPDYSQLIAKYGSMQGLGFPAWKGLDPTKIFYEDGSPAYDENGLPRDPDDWFSIHFQGAGENVYQDYVYNIEVADWHTYFVGLEGIWVHNCGGADMAHP